MATLSASSFSAVQVLAVAVGAAAGALLRWCTSLLLDDSWHGFPVGTLLVNCCGGLLIGMTMTWFAKYPDETLRLLVVTGMLGGLTTFSTFSAESLALLLRGHFGLASLHTLAHVVGSLGSAAIGFHLGRTLWD